MTKNESKVIRMKEKFKKVFTMGFVKVATWTIIIVVTFIDIMNWITKRKVNVNR